MAYDDKARSAAVPHCLTLDERQKLTVSGVEEVVSFDEEEITARTVKGLLVVRGSGLRVDQLEKSAGQLALSGLVTTLQYEETDRGAGFWSRLFR